MKDQEDGKTRPQPPLAGGRPLAELWLQVGPAALALLVLAGTAVVAEGTPHRWLLGSLVVLAFAGALGLTTSISTLRRNWQAVHRQRAEQEHASARALAEAADGIVALDLQGHLVSLNEQARELFGYSSNDLATISLEDLIQIPADEEPVSPPTLPAFGKKIVSSGRTKTQRPLALEVLPVPPPTADGSQVWLLVWDRTDATEAKRKLARLEFIAEESPHPIVEIDPSGRVTFANPSAERQFPDLRSHGAAHHPLLRDLSSVVERLRSGRERSLIRELAVGPHLYEQHIASVPSSGTLRVFSFDVTDRREALRDGLTGLPNRASFTRRLHRVSVLAEGDPTYAFAVLFLDLDRFKVLNDTLGHGTGDELLQAVSQRLETCLRPNDMVARIGGDEFTILLDGVRDQAESEVITQRILNRLHRPFELEPHTVFTSASVGIALSTVGYDEPLDLVACADAAMYRAKTEGRARLVVFDATVDGRAVPGRLF